MNRKYKLIDSEGFNLGWVSESNLDEYFSRLSWI